jgi:hypothetical protein
MSYLTFLSLLAQAASPNDIYQTKVQAIVQEASKNLKQGDNVVVIPNNVVKEEVAPGKLFLFNLEMHA